MENNQRFEEILLFAIKNNVSDIHFIKENDSFKILLRIYDSFKDITKENDNISICLYLAYLANLDIYDNLHPQSGSFIYKFLNNEYYMRFSLINSMNVSSFVLRILYQKYKYKNLSELDSQNIMFMNAINHENGLILFSGPCGSGKTTSAYNLLSFIKNKAIFTIEDPIEMILDNVIQLQVNNKCNLTYENGIKQILRHDPDVIFIGEIRDENEAKMAVRAALTGHLVISTIHAKSSKGAFNRLIDLNVNENDLFETLILITNQEIISIDNRKTCLYEIMDEEEIKYYHQNKKHRENFLDLKTQKDHYLKERQN